MISMKDFEDKDGKIDWKAYHLAQENAGERCPGCGTWMFNLKNPHKHLCSECHDIRESKDEVYHPEYIRCPKCKESWKPSNCYEDGDHDITCHNCNHEFSITTQVSYNFTSPELIKEQDSEN